MFGNASLGMQRRSPPLGSCNGLSSKAQNPTFRLRRGYNQYPLAELENRNPTVRAKVDQLNSKVIGLNEPFRETSHRLIKFRCPLQEG
jgi:hypothetical protein